MDSLIAEDELRRDGLQQDMEKPHEVRTHEAFCNREDVTTIFQ